MIREYSEYLKDNPKEYWFKRKIYGWGWTPAKWQGWAVIILYLLTIALFVNNINNNWTEKEIVFKFFLPVILATILLLYICYKKGERPKWQWGIPKKSS